MKLAIVCDDLIQFGGAEKVVEELSDLYPTSPIYTSITSQKWLERLKNKGRVVKTSFMQKLPYHEKLYRYFAPFLLYELAFGSFDFSTFDVVLSSSSRFAHHIITKPTTKHICYMHSPPRMLWETHDYFENENFDKISFAKKVARAFLSIPLQIMRIVDYISSQRVDEFIANSTSTQEKIFKYYHKKSKVIYPFVEIDKYKNVNPQNGDYFLVLTRLLSWKRVDIAILACNELGLLLKIIGEGPDMERLKMMSGPTIEFLGKVSDEQKRKYLKDCKALIETQKEDFGIVPLETMACCKPVIAYSFGGVTETVINGTTGVFFSSQTPESLKEVLKDFDETKYKGDDCLSQAMKFSKVVFKEKISQEVKV